MDELTTSIAGIDFPNEDKSKSNRRMECMLCAPGELVELRLEPKNPYNENAVAIWSERGVQLGYVSAERAPLIGKRMGQDEVSRSSRRCTGTGPISGSGSEAGYLTLPDPVSDISKPQPPRQMRPAQRPVYHPTRFILMRKGWSSGHGRG